MTVSNVRLVPTAMLKVVVMLLFASHAMQVSTAAEAVQRAGAQVHVQQDDTQQLRQVLDQTH